MRKRVQQLLARRTTSNTLIPEIDGFRFFAIATVVLYHLHTHFTRNISDAPADFYSNSNWLRYFISHGSLGVDVFFAISGFILALPFARQRLFNEKPISLKGYYVRRLTRLEPPYVVSLILLLLVHIVILHKNFGDLFPHFLASLFYVHNIVYDSWSVINPVAWSLEVEVQFYLLAPALAAVFSIRNAITRRIVIGLVILINILHYNFNYEMIETLHLRKSLFMHLHMFMVGFLFADFFLTDWKETLKHRSYAFDIAGIGAMLLLFVFNIPFSPLADLGFVVCLFVAFVALFKGKLIQAFFSNPWIVVTGGMCYSIYLLHYVAIAFLTEFSIRVFDPEWGYLVNYAIQFILIIPIVWIISAVFFVLIEKPCMDKEWHTKLFAKVKAIFA